MTDLTLIFPPQWSAFQPPLSLPALAAWLRRSGFSIAVVDANICLYDWLFSDVCGQLLTEKLDEVSESAGNRATLELLLRSLPDFRSALSLLRSSPMHDVSDGDMLLRHRGAVRSLETWLSLVSHVSPDFSITPYNFQLKNHDYSEKGLEEAVSKPSPVLSRFVSDFLSNLDLTKTQCIGLSCIGQEQLFFTLLFCASLRRITSAPIIVGGTIFTRIYERGVMPPAWFKHYFDVIVKNEGEVPCEALLQNLNAGRAITTDVPGIIYLSGGRIVSTKSPPSLQPRDVPTPDFDGMPLEKYLSPSLTLPILSARGCYWGKCEFCHHGMVYGEKYAAYEVDQLLNDVQSLSAKYGAKHFSFNDEALPPKVARGIGLNFPSTAQSGWTFSALYKFEKFYTAQDFVQLHRIGLRSLYVGMESASERVLSLMRKPNTRDVVTRNLRDAHEAGIWTHCFLFFGFPGETEEDAQETYDYVFSNQDIIASVGCGSFSLEHNAPMFSHLDDFGVTLSRGNSSDLSVYYDYEVKHGNGERESNIWTDRFNDHLYSIPKYLSVAWIPRDQLLLMLSRMSPNRLISVASEQLQSADSMQRLEIHHVFSPVFPQEQADPVVIIDRLTGRVMQLRNRAAILFRALYEERARLEDVKERHPRLHAALFPTTVRAIAEGGSAQLEKLSL